MIRRSSWPPEAWDLDVNWFTRRTVAPTDLPVTADFIGNQVLRVVNGSADDEFIEAAITAATQQAEEETQRALMPQTWQMVLDRFPCSGKIHVERPPFLSVVSLAYYDADNAVQELAVSPAEFDVIPSGMYSKAIVKPLGAASFPATYCRPDAVTLTYRAGYDDPDDPELQTINLGIGLMVGELYKLRSLSVQAIHNTPSVLQTSRFWRRVW